MAQTKRAAGKRSLASLQRATELLSTMLAQEVRELSERQKARKAGGENASTLRELKETTGVLKDLAGVAKTLNEQGAGAEAAGCGVVLLPAVEDV